MSIVADKLKKMLAGRRKRDHYKKVPTVLQMEAVECGAASLAMVLACHGRILPLEELRIACNVSRDGTNASNLVKAARTFGLKAKGFRKEPAQLRELAMPVIIHWNFNHFLVLEGFKGGRAILNDPAQGRFIVTLAELDQAFTGVVLVFEPGPEFQRGDEKPGLVASLMPRLKGSRPDLIHILLLTLALVIPGLVVPAFTKIFIDQYLILRLHDWVPLLLVCMFGMLLLNASLTWLQQRHLLLLETRLALSTSAQFLWHILQLPLEFFSQRFGGEIGSRVTINDRVARLLSGELATMVLSLFTVLFYLALMFAYDWVLALVSLGIALLNFVLLYGFNELRRDTSRRLQQETGKLLGATLGGLLTIEPLKSSGGESDFYAKWIGYFGKTVNAEQKLGATDRILSVTPGLLLSLNTAAVLCIGGLRVMDGAMSMGTVIAFFYLMHNFLAPVGRFVQLGALLQSAEADLGRIDDVLRYRRAPGLNLDESDAGRQAVADAADSAQAKLGGALELKNLTYGYYRLGAPLIEDFSLILAPGARVALVGGSGSGKSTLARIVCGLHEPWQGEVLFDDRPRTGWPRSVVSNSLAFVDQDLLVFEDSVRQNLSLWNNTLPDAQLVRAAKDACIHDDIMARPGGYDGLVREGGANFSGGQLQRLELARALAQNPSLLVLDEATSALDAHTEMQVMENLRRRGCTCLLVSHRLSAIRDCDEIIVLRYGKVVQRGTHEALIAEGGHYAALLGAA